MGKLVLLCRRLEWLKFLILKLAHIGDADAFELISFWFHLTHVSLCFLKVTKLFFDVCLCTSWWRTECCVLPTMCYTFCLVFVIKLQACLLCCLKFRELVSSDTILHLPLHATWSSQRHHVEGLEPSIVLIEFWELTLNAHVIGQLVWFELDAWSLGT